MPEPSHTPCPLCGKSEEEEITAILDSARNRILGVLVGREHRKKISGSKNDVFDCYLIENMTQQEIADELGISQPAVSQHLDTALLILQDLISFYETYPFRLNVMYE
jgi:DNA-directed RNA polymerase specialized sigma subunit